MKRRNFLVGVGGASIGGSALLGSGAFSRVESQRQVDIRIAHDRDAYLGLIRKDPEEYPNASFVSYDEKGHLQIALEEADPGGGGMGVNSNSLNFFDDMFTIRNQGKQSVSVCMDPTDLEITPDEDRGEDQTENAEDVVIFYKGNAKGSQGLDGITPIHCHDRAEPWADDATGDSYCWDDLAESHSHKLRVGEELQVGLLVCTKGSSLGASTTISGETRILADADKEADQMVEMENLSITGMCSVEMQNEVENEEIESSEYFLWRLYNPNDWYVDAEVACTGHDFSAPLTVPPNVTRGEGDEPWIPGYYILTDAQCDPAILSVDGEQQDTAGIDPGKECEEFEMDIINYLLDTGEGAVLVEDEDDVPE